MDASTRYRAWTVGVTASMALVVAAFVPWFVGEGSFGMHEGGMGVPGVRFPVGVVGLSAGLLSLGAWLLGQTRTAGVFALAGGAAVAAAHLDLVPFLAVTAERQWGLWLYLAASVLAVGVAFTQPRRDGAARDALKTAIDRRLNPGDQDSKAVDTFIISLIALNIILVMLETEPAVAQAYAPWFIVAETVSTLIFAVEYVLRIWVADRHGSRWRYSLSGMALVDLIAIAPFFLQFIQMDLRIARAIRLMRLVRILKMGRYAKAVRTLANVVVDKKEELAISTFVSAMILILSASAMYFAEHDAQPEAFRSIPSTMWWAVVTLTSVGYGDVSPITGIGQVIGAVVCLAGVLLVALPTGILASGFLEEMRKQRLGEESYVFGFCPHCGEKLLPHEED